MIYNRISSLPKGSTSPFVFKIEASAGAGKTYRLTQRFLEILATLAPAPQHLRSVVAITFTNKAACEMKERLVRTLKEIALGTPYGQQFAEKTGFSPQAARQWLELIFEHYHDLQVRTIDSLVFTILKGVALEAGLRPDLEAELKEDVLLARAYDRLLLSLRDGSLALRDVFREVLLAYLEIETKGGFNPEKGIRKTLLDLFRYELKGRPLEANKEECPLSALEEKVKQAAFQFLQAVKERGFVFRYPSWQVKFEDPIDNFSATPFWKNFAWELFKASRKDEELENLYTRFKRLLEEYLLARAIIRLVPYARLYEFLKAELERLRRQEGLIHGGGWVEIVEKILRAEGVPLVYCKLGAKFRHFLIDEFQDTSRQQWEALRPLVEEALSTGGTLTYVGDVKQAIYVWRGGDPVLFSEAARDLPVPLIEEPLLYNWRAREKLVTFNNTFFSLLADEGVARLIAQRFLYGQKKEGRNCPYVAEFAETIAATFAKVSQKVPENRPGGQVEIVTLTGETALEIKENTLDSLRKLLPPVFREYAGQGEVAILVRTNDQAEEVAKLLFELEIPAITENALRLANSPLIRALISLLTFLDYPLHDVALVGFLRSPIAQGYFKLPPHFWRERLGAGPLVELLKDLDQAGYNRYLKPLLEKVGFLSPYDLVREIFETFRLYERFPEEEAFLHRFLSLVLSFEQDGVGLSAFLERWQERGFEERLGLPEELEAVKILTIHGAKGLEFDVVFLPFLHWEPKVPRLVTLAEGRLGYVQQPYPGPIREKVLKDKAEQALESLNLLYVAFTRAKERLYLFVPEKAPERARFGTADVVRYFLERLGYLGRAS